jgi:hypothetical protein
VELPSHDPNIPRTMEDDITTSEHHYIPKFYLKGFTDSNGMLYRYDKQRDSIRYIAPGSIFKEDNLNTGILKHPDTGEMHFWDLPEHLFSKLDTKLADALAILRQTDATINIMASPAVVDTVKHLIHFLFWRTPANKDYLNKLIDEKTFGDIGFGFFDAKGNRITEWEEKMKDIDLWRKLYPALIASGRKYSAFQKNNPVDWGVYYMNWDHSLTTDNPIVLKSFDGPASLEGNLLFPLSVNMLVVAVEGEKNKSLPAIIREQIDVLLFHQAQRYIACPKR